MELLKQLPYTRKKETSAPLRYSISMSYMRIMHQRSTTGAPFSRASHGLKSDQRVGSVFGLKLLAGRVGSGQEVLENVTGQVRRWSKCHGSGRVTLTRSDPREAT